MNIDQITGPLRAIVPVLTAWAAGSGYIPAGDYATPIVGVVTGVMALWSIWSNRAKS